MRLASRLRPGFVALAILFVPFVGHAAMRPHGTIAVTFDDLPIYGRAAAIAEAQSITASLLGGFRRNHWPVTGFVIEGELKGPDRDKRIGLLRAWLDAGMDLGNHSFSHCSLNTLPVGAYIRDVSRGARVTSALLAARGRTDRWFRHPYLETGTTLPIRRRFETWLASHGYRVAPVSMENSDWQFDDAYDVAQLRGRTSDAIRIRRTYLNYTRRAVAWYRGAAAGLLGRQPAFVLLLHASRLNAVSIDQLAAILRANRLKAVSLREAMTDPAYRIQDHYVGTDGEEWLSRWEEVLGKSLPWDSFPKVPVAIVRAANAIETDQVDKACSRAAAAGRPWR